MSLFLNRSARCFSLIVSATGGMEIESTENRFIMDITPNDDIEDIAKRIAGIAGLGSENRQKFVEFVQKLYRLSEGERSGTRGGKSGRPSNGRVDSGLGL